MLKIPVQSSNHHFMKSLIRLLLSFMMLIPLLIYAFFPENSTPSAEPEHLL